MKKSKVAVIKYIMLVCFVNVSLAGFAQTKDSTAHVHKEFKNSIKLNLTTPLLYPNALQVGYERVLNKNHSITFFGGYLEAPGNIKLNLANTTLGSSKKKWGYSVGMEYRFYLASENKYGAPRGVYLAPFASVLNMHGDRTLVHTDSSGNKSSSNLSTRITIINIGAELGYQFVIKNRWVIDIVALGPAISHYHFKAKLDGKIPGLDENETAKAVIDAMVEKFPLLGNLANEGTISSSGTTNFWNAGFRYSISVGFRF